MAQVRSGAIVMKPRWYFLLGSLLLTVGLIGLSIGALFLTNLTFFLMRQHGPMGTVRLQMMLATFPWWIPILAIAGMVMGIVLLKKFDFSYRKNFSLMVVAFIAAILIAAFLIDVTGISDTWFGKGRMRRLYQPNQQIQQNQPSQQKQGARQGRFTFKSQKTSIN